MTPDLGRFASFYTDVIGLRLVVVLRQNHEPYLRHAVFQVGASATVIHGFEHPGYDPIAEGLGVERGHRGRLDHFGFMVPDGLELQEVAARLRAAGASDGEVRSLGPVLSVHYRDPDGLEGEINAPNPAFAPDQPGACTVETLGDSSWLEALNQ